MQTAEDIMGRAASLPPGDAVTLPVLTGVDLCALGAAGLPLVEQDLFSWWSGRSQADQLALASRSKATLTERGLIEGGRPSATIGIIVAARRNPLFIALCQPPSPGTGGGPAVELRCYGIPGEERGLRAVLVEQKLSDPAKGPVSVGYRYFLCAVAGAARQLAAWASEPPGRKMLRKPSRTIEVYRAGHGAVPDRLEITRDKGEVMVTENGGQPAACSDEAALGERVAALLAGGLR